MCDPAPIDVLACNAPRPLIQHKSSHLTSFSYIAALLVKDANPQDANMTIHNTNPLRPPSLQDAKEE